MTPIEFYESLRDLPSDAPIIFEAPNGAISGGYHVTEWKAADITSIDCGGKINKFKAAHLQLLDGRGGAFMTVGKFNAILKTSLEQVAGLAESPLRVEFGQGNREMRLYEIAAPEWADDRVTIMLGDANAVCKPAERAKTALGTGCCGSAKSSCC